MSTIYTTGRYTPLQWGHVNYFKWLLSMYDRLIIGIGSCYEVGFPRHPLLAFLREKMIAYSLMEQGVDAFRVSFVHLQDFNDWDEWWNHITSIPQIGGVSHFVTGNEEDILGEIKKKGIDLPFKLINPEKDMPERLKFPFHASDLRKAIIEGDYSLFQQIAAPGTIALMSHAGGFNGMRQAMEGRAPCFVPGRQTVDMIVILRKNGEEPKVLCGYRNDSEKPFYGKLSFPGDAIKTYENPMDAAVRTLEEKTGIKCEIVARHLEPAHVMIKKRIFDMRFLGLFSATDTSLAGDKGGSSQPFCIEMDDWNGKMFDRKDLSGISFRPVKEVLAKGMAYQQSEMLAKALAN